MTAVICGDDLYAYGVMRACRTLGVPIPGELSLVGFDDLPYSEFTAPSLTTVNRIHGPGISRRERSRSGGR